MPLNPVRCRLAVKAIPNAPRSELAGWIGEVLKVKIHAPALDGKANQALCDFMAETLGLPRRSVSLVQGDKSRQKLIQIEGLNLADLKARLRQA